MDVLVVGGYPSLLQGAYGKKLAQKGVHIRWHEPRGAVLDCIPEACEGVLILKDLVNHQLAGLAIGHAKAKGVPFVQVTRKFSQAFPILESSGFLRSTKTETEPTKQDLAPQDAPTTAVRVSKFLKAPTPTPPPSPVSVSEEDIQEAVNLIFSEDPYSSKNPELFRQRLQDLVKMAIQADLVVAKIEEKLQHVRSLTGRWISKEDKEYRNLIRDRWMISYVSEVYSQTGRFPTSNDLRSEALSTFKIHFHSDYVSRMLEESSRHLGINRSDVPANRRWPKADDQEAPEAEPTDETVGVADTPKEQEAPIVHDALIDRIASLEAAVAALTTTVESLRALLEAPRPASPLDALMELTTKGLVVTISPK